MVKFSFSRPLSVFQVLFKTNFIFKDFQDSPVYSSTFQACENPAVKPVRVSVLSGHSKIDKTKVLKTNDSVMKGGSIAECSLGALCNSFDLH